MLCNGFKHSGKVSKLRSGNRLIEFDFLGIDDLQEGCQQSKCDEKESS